MISFKQYIEEEHLEEGRLSKLALIGAIILGVASGDAAQVSSRDVQKWKSDYNSLTVKNKKKVLSLIGNQSKLNENDIEKKIKEYV